MLTVRSPLRISLGGGGTDLPAWFERRQGFVVSTTIDRGIEITVEPTQGPRTVLDHLETEHVLDVADVSHPILRATLLRHGDGRPLRLTSRGDVPPGTGLGSSGSYTVAAVKAVAAFAGTDLAGTELAEAACSIELDDLGRTVGKQDQYAAALGGVNAFEFASGGEVSVRPLAISPETLDRLDSRLLLFSTGRQRSAADQLAGVVRRASAHDASLVENLNASATHARETAAALEQGDLDAVGELLNRQWALKRERLPGPSTEHFEPLRRAAFDAGASGATLTGAGGGGYVLVYARDPGEVRAAMDVAELDFRLESGGATLHSR